MTNEESFDRLIAEALQQPFTGWNFSWLKGRWQSAELPWDYRERALTLKSSAQAMLDMGTGGGEFLAGLAPFPPLTCATESYPPNVAVARARLEPLGITVTQVSTDEKSLLPYASGLFDLVINRHDSYNSGEVFRVLRPGGRFVTQQVGGENCMDLNRALGDHRPYEYAYWTRDYMVDKLRQAGFTIVDAREHFSPLTFFDIGAVVFYLKAVPWQLPGFSVEAYRQPLLELHRQIQNEGRFVIREHRIFLEVVKGD